MTKGRGAVLRPNKNGGGSPSINVSNSRAKMHWLRPLVTPFNLVAKVVKNERVVTNYRNQQMLINVSEFLQLVGNMAFFVTIHAEKPCGAKLSKFHFVYLVVNKNFCSFKEIVG